MSQQDANLRVTNGTNSKLEATKQSKEGCVAARALRIILFQVVNLQHILVNVSSSNDDPNEVLDHVPPNRRERDTQLSELVISVDLNGDPVVLHSNAPNDVSIRLICWLEVIQKVESRGLVIPHSRWAEQCIGLLESEDFKSVVNLIRCSPTRKLVENLQPLSNPVVEIMGLELSW